MELFGTQISEIQKYVPVDSTLEMQTLEPYQEEVKNLYLLNWLGIEQYEALVDNYNDLDTHQAKLLPYVQRVMSNFMVRLYLDVPVSISNSGISRIESDNEKTAYKYQVAEVKERLTKSGWNAIESMTNFLNKNKDNYPLWSESGARKRTKSLLINTYAEFKEVYHVVHGRWIFEGLRAIMEDIELFSIIPLIGATYYDSLKSKLLEDTLSDDNEIALKFIQKAIAYLTIEQAINQKIGTIKNNSFVFVESTGNDAINQINIAYNTKSKKNNASTMGNRYLNYVKYYLTENIDRYPDFASQIEPEPEEGIAANTTQSSERKVFVI